MITLEGFYRYDPTLLDGVVLPTGMDTTIQKELIIERSGMLFPFHQQPDHLKKNIANWFTRKLPSFERMYTALSAEYNPIENYDRKEDWTDTPDVARTRTGGHTSYNDAKQDTDGEGKVSAFNSDTYQPDSKAFTTTSAHNTETFNYNNETETETGTRTHTGRMHGNIGVTTNQQMIESELNLRMYDLYETIATMFENAFLIQVY